MNGENWRKENNTSRLGNWKNRERENPDAMEDASVVFDQQVRQWKYELRIDSR